MIGLPLALLACCASCLEPKAAVLCLSAYAALYALAARLFAGGFSQGRRVATARTRRHIQMLLIPELGAERVLLKHVYVIEALRGKIALVLDQRIVGAAHIREPGAACPGMKLR